MPRHDLKSWKLNVENGQTEGSIQWTLSAPCDLVALHLFPINSILGDKVKIQLLYGETVVDTYATDTYIAKSDVHMNFDRQDPLAIPAGLTIKLIYTAVDTNGRDLILWIRYKQ